MEVNLRFRIPTLSDLLKLAGLTVAMLALALCAARDSVQSAGTYSITSPDTAGNVGQYTSFVLDAAGFPVVSYFDSGNGNLKLMHCNDADCSGGGESVTSPDTVGVVGEFSSLALDASGFPVVSYYDSNNGELKVMHCNDGNCAGGDESIISTNFGFFNVGTFSSLALDSSGFPVVGFMHQNNLDLMVMHCNDPDCAGDDESITSPDTGFVGQQTSLELDASGFPVVSYHESLGGNLKVLHCNDANCAGNDESITSPDTSGAAGQHSSLALDALGFPVISYYESNGEDLRIMHCNDANCSGGDESIQSPDAAANAGQYTSLVLDALGFPVVSYYDSGNGNLKLLHCNDANCAGGGESVRSPDTVGNVGQFTSIALDEMGRPVASYYDVTNADLKVMHCQTQCLDNSNLQEILIAGLTSGWPVEPIRGACYRVDPAGGLGDPPFVVCDNETGAGVDTSSACTKDGSAACTDDDPVIGSVLVAVNTQAYNVAADSAPGHTPDSHLKACNLSLGVDAKCTFTHTPLTRPWFPWDVNGDGAVSGVDFFRVLGHFNETK